MMRLKPALFLALIINFYTLTWAYAWPSADYIVSTMIFELKLSTEQADQVRPIIENNFAMRKATISQVKFGKADQGILVSKDQALTGIGMDADTEQLLDEDLTNKLSKILTHEQMTKWKLLAVDLRNQ